MKILRVNECNSTIPVNFILLSQDSLITYNTRHLNHAKNEKFLTSDKKNFLGISKDFIMSINLYRSHSYSYKAYIARVLSHNVDADLIEYLVKYYKKNSKPIIKNNLLVIPKILEYNLSEETLKLNNNNVTKFIIKGLSYWPLSYFPEIKTFLAYYFLDVKFVLLHSEVLLERMTNLLQLKFKIRDIDVKSFVITEDLINQFKYELQIIHAHVTESIYYYIFKTYKLYTKYRNLLYLKIKTCLDEILSNNRREYSNRNNKKFNNSFNISISKMSKLLNIEKIYEVLDKYNLCIEDVYNKSEKFIELQDVIISELEYLATFEN